MLEVTGLYLSCLLRAGCVIRRTSAGEAAAHPDPDPSMQSMLSAADLLAAIVACPHPLQSFQGPGTCPLLACVAVLQS